MRILIIIYEYPPIGGGGGAAARDICRGLVRRGHEVKVLTAHYQGLPTRQQDEGVDVIRLQSLRRRLYQAGIPEMGGFVLASLWAGLRLTRVFHADVIHTHFAVPSGASAWALSRLTRIPYLLTAHLGDVPGGVPDKTEKWFRWIKPFTNSIWRDAARVAAVSNYTRELALKHYPVSIQVIPNGVDASALAPRALKVNDPPRLVFAGRFVTQKNPLMVPRVLSTLKNLRWECVMLGNGAMLEETRAEAERLGIANRFKFPGWVETSDVLTEFSRSDILFMPSRVEGLPVVGVQALACGLALVVGRAGGFADLVAHGENGFLHDAEDADGLSTSLRSLLSNPNALYHARKKSLTLAQSFDIEHVVDEYEKTLLAITNREPR